MQWVNQTDILYLSLIQPNRRLHTLSLRILAAQQITPVEKAFETHPLIELYLSIEVTYQSLN